MLDVAVFLAFTSELWIALARCFLVRTALSLLRPSGDPTRGNVYSFACPDRIHAAPNGASDRPRKRVAPKEPNT
jgi:hypothetical protein